MMTFLGRIFLFVASMAWFSIAQAETIRIVCFGSSNTYGAYLARADAYPAQLEALLKAKGYDVTVKNEGINSQTSSEELRRLNSAVPDGTAIVIFQPGGIDKKRGGNAEENIVAIVQKLLDRKIDVIFSGPPPQQKLIRSTFHISTIDTFPRLAPDDLQSDREHLTPRGYHIVAEILLPLVEKLIQLGQPR